MRIVKKTVMSLSVIALLLPVISCEAALPPALANYWVLESGHERSVEWREQMEFLKDGTGVINGKTVSWKVENNRFYIQSSSDGYAYDYKISGSRLTLVDKNGDTQVYVTKAEHEKMVARKKAEKERAEKEAAAERERAEKEAAAALQKTLAAAESESKKSLASISSFKDSRDNKTYKTVTIGGKTWMAENLNYQTSDSWCYGNNSSNCDKYGRLYNWNAAMKACPAGWHLPNRAEWDNLAQTVGGLREPDDDGNIDWKGAGAQLKSTAGWSNNGNGNNKFGFSALPGGFRYSVGIFDNAGYDGSWWTATENGSGRAYFWGMGCNLEYVGERSLDRSIGFSVRCLQN